jgi:serine/threonine-protein kinase
LPAPPAGAVAISRDGALLAFVGCRADDCAIYLRPLSQAEPMLLNGTTGGQAPFFSPDGRSIGFFANGKLVTLSLGGGSPTAIADAVAALGATWTNDGDIIFAGASSPGLATVPERGGRPRILTTADAGTTHAWPDVLPDGSAAVFTVTGRDAAQTYAALLTLRASGWVRLIDGVTGARAAFPGFLLARRRRGCGPVENRTILSFPVPV